LGKTELWIGNDTTPYATTGLTKCSQPIYDTGRYPVTPPTTGDQIVLRRDGYSSVGPPDGGTHYQATEIRVYQSPNLLQHFQGKVTVSAPAPKAPEFAATNLITNLDSRSSGNNNRPLIDVFGNRATYQPCFKTTNVELGPEGHIQVLGFDLSETVFMHAILLVQDFFTGRRASDHTNQNEFF